MEFDAIFQETYQRWWFGGFVLPLLFGATIGSAMSIYTNWFTSRLMMYRQEIQRAQEMALGFIDTFRGAILQRDESEAEVRFQWIVLLPAMSLQRHQQQYRAGWRVQHIGKLIEEGALRSWRRMNAARDSVHGPRVVSEETEKFQEAIIHAVELIGQTKPDYWRMAGIPSFGKVAKPVYYRYLRMRVRCRRLQRYVNDEER